MGLSLSWRQHHALSFHFSLYGLLVPQAEELLHPLAAVALAFLEALALLYVDGHAFLVEHHEDRVAEAAGVAEELHGLQVLVLLGVIYVDIDVVLLHQRRYDAVLDGELREAQAPRTPVAAHLAHNVSSRLLRQRCGFAYLLHGVDAFVVDLRDLCLNTAGQTQRQCQKQ